MNRQQLYALIVLLFSAVVAMLPNSVLFPATRDIAVHLHVPVSFVGLMVTVYSVAYVASTPFLGIWSDRAGRKQVLVLGLLLFSAGGLVPLFSHNGTFILAGRFIMGMGSAGILPMVDSTIGDMFLPGAPRRKALAGFGAAIAVAEAILPFLSGVADHVSWRGVFLLYSGGILGALLTAFMAWPKQVDGVPTKSDKADMKSYYRALLVASAIPTLAGTLVSTVLFGVVYFGVSALLPQSIANGANGLLNGILFLPLGVSWVASSTWFAKRPHIVHVHRAALLGSIVLALATLWLSFTHVLWILLVISLFWGLGSGVLTTLFSWVIGDDTPARVRGAVNALYNAAYVLGFAVGAPLFMYLKQAYSYQFSATMASFVMFASGVTGYFFFRRHGHHTAAPTDAAVDEKNLVP
ncbi:MFS transporter [Alicyclobacillus tolerans]|uniref:MFS transporter n=1 Tax=Alicyclobacillus tolerans TaxID=90970 RepID=UPI001F021E5A|nr:MFS transporter [Alicyclobacillus tolerans]MCF8564123.1 MFS transporter [Alicyclobacillus tolerans]